MSEKSIKHNPYKIVKMFEEEVAEYTDAPYAVAVDSCSNALFLCLMYFKHIGRIYPNIGYKSIDNEWIEEIIIPSKTYLSVPLSIIHAGYTPVFKDYNWSGIYQLDPYPLYDSAKRLTRDMYIPDSFMCLSFHIKKILSIGKGGMILTDNPDAVEWFKKARYEGRSEKNYKDDNIDMLGWNMYMTPEQATRGLMLFDKIKNKRLKDLSIKEQGYPDLSKWRIYK